MNTLFCSALLTGLGLPFLQTPALAQSATNQLQALVAGNTAFGLQLYGQLRVAPGNLFFSPYSISTCLAMTYAGARGTTAQQMAQALHFSPDQSQVQADFGQLQQQLSQAEQQKGVVLHVANALWGQAGHPWRPEFLKIVRGEFHANVNQADFLSGAEAARSQINQWIAQQTQDKIQDLLPAGSLNPSTRLVLANAIYFKGTWAKQFNKSATQLQPFHLNATSQVQIPLMHHLDSVGYMENEQFQAVELPYLGQELAMLILLPHQINGCGQLEAQLSPALLAEALGKMKRQNVDIFLPRFKLESRFNLNQPLEKMGLQDPFGTTADFSGIDGRRDLFISAVFHKAWGEVNEEGTEAAAATGTVMALGAMQRPTPPSIFRADHPFLFFIRHTRSGSLLFMGRLQEPKS